MKGNRGSGWRGTSEESMARWTFGLFGAFGLVWVLLMFASIAFHHGGVEAGANEPAPVVVYSESAVKYGNLLQSSDAAPQ